jgi:uncharacterized protein
VDERRRQLLESSYAALARGDLEAALRYVDPEAEIATSGAFLDQGVVYRGHEGAREFFAMVDEAFDELAYELLELEEVDDDRVLAIVRLRGRGKGSGLEVDRKGAHLWTLRGDTAIRMEGFADPDTARAAAGLT